MNRATKILPLAIAILALAGCSNDAQGEAETAAVAFFKASSAEACSMFTGRSEAEITECESAAESQNVQADPYSDEDYSTKPYAAKTQERGEGYAVLVEATETDGETIREVLGLVLEGEAWKVDEFHTLEEQSDTTDLCSHIGGECK